MRVGQWLATCARNADAGMRSVIELMQARENGAYAVDPKFEPAPGRFESALTWIKRATLVTDAAERRAFVTEALALLHPSR